MRWTLTLACRTCSAEISFADERPAWQPDAELAAEIRAAEAWLEIHPGARWDIGGFVDETGRYIRSRVPTRVDHDEQGRLFVSRPDGRFILCPVCDGRVYLAHQRLTPARTTDE
ncbi:MAG: hypothetical protein IT305_08535 [Chloroflexi bacterium]|nr:hypothetical protein [Chloroflexota bacterium]